MAYKVKKQFTDAKGKAWKQGEPYTGSEDEAQQQIALGNVEEDHGSPPPGTGKGGGERGGAPA